MKKFTFSLERVLDLRQTQARIEESKLQLLYAERAAIDLKERALQDERWQEEAGLSRRSDVAGEELAALDTFQRHVQAEGRRSAEARAACTGRIQRQLQALTARHRDVRLLEKLKSRHYMTWNRAFEREIGSQAEESHLAKWNRENLQ